MAERWGDVENWPITEADLIALLDVAMDAALPYLGRSLVEMALVRMGWMPPPADPWPDAPLGDAGSIKGGEAEMVELTSPRYIPSGEELLRAAAEIDGERPAGSGAVVGTGGAAEAITAGEEIP